MASFSEKRLVEDFLAGGLERLGWTYIPPQDVQAGLEDVLIISELEDAIQRLNPDLDLSPEERRQALNRLRLLGSGVEGHKHTLEYLKRGIPLKREKSHEVVRIRLLDPHDPTRNRYTFTRQLPIEGNEPIRPDILLFVNGIPLVDIECKNPTRPGVSWEDAYVQIKRYEQAVPELFRFIQIGVAAEREARYFPIVPWQEEVHTYAWRTTREDEDPLEALLDFLRPVRLMDFLQYFLYFREERGEYTKVMARYMQVRAVNRIVRRVLMNMGRPLPPLLQEEDRDDLDKTRGLIWHWQGSGKTLTMIFASQKLFRLLGNPTFFFVVDRVDLQDQLEREFSALHIPVGARQIESVRDLQRVLRADGYRGARGIFITLIHKFRPEEFKRFREEVQREVGDGPSFHTRSDIVLFVDEGHRTQYGVLGAEMYALFPAGFAFGFTGTPLAVHGRDTFQVFAYPDRGELYLDKYFVSDSLRDGYTVPIVYQPRLERDVHLRRDLLEAFLELELEEIPEDRREDVEDALARRLDQIRLFLENEQRIDRVARDIAEHFREYLNGRFKGMVVAVSRRACVLFKRALDRYLPPEWSEVVMTFNTAEDEPDLQAFRQAWYARNPGASFRDAVSGVLHRFRTEENPRLLIVTDMLLTGFDAPILQTLYLVRLLKGHRLLQAVARVNRPFRDAKKAGLVVDYVGVLRHLKRAFAMYREEEIRQILRTYGSLADDFRSLLEEMLDFFAGLALRFERRALLQAFERITRVEKDEIWFREQYHTLRQLYELLPPDALKREAWDAYKWLTAVYVYYRKMARPGPDRITVDRLFHRTLRMIHRATEIQELERALPEVRFDETYFRALEQAELSMEEKAAGALFALNRFVLVDKTADPVFQSLTERVERLVEQWRYHTRDYRKIYEEAVAILKELERRRERQRRLGLSPAGYALLLLLEEMGEEVAWEDKVREWMAILEPLMSPGWKSQPALRKRVERKLRTFARSLKRELGLSFEAMDRLHDRMMEALLRYER